MYRNLKKEIEIVKPYHIVLVTGEWWLKLKELKLDKTFESELNIKFNNNNSFVIGN